MRNEHTPSTIHGEIDQMSIHRNCNCNIFLPKLRHCPEKSPYATAEFGAKKDGYHSLIILTSTHGKIGCRNILGRRLLKRISSNLSLTTDVWILRETKNRYTKCLNGNPSEEKTTLLKRIWRSNYRQITTYMEYCSRKDLRRYGIHTLSASFLFYVSYSKTESATGELRLSI